MEPTRRRHYRWLLALPFVWQVALIPAVNDVHVFPLGLPFPMVWQMLGVVFATVVIAVVFRLDRRAGVEAEEEAFLLECEAADRGDAPR
ncbi:DUF3311 domain-containing protein [Pseudonocardia spinosispora]|uniref:DUF3311 domain-containing protein n=1 Tax=Pseudonocardia spinosispora TaxID=103441 RepID=UPI00041F6C92|nr:DUF3311 domain-containing protein [Pseudonocardia spinosispora]